MNPYKLFFNLRSSYEKCERPPIDVFFRESLSKFIFKEAIQKEKIEKY